MPRTNVLLLNTAYLVASGAACGVSTLVSVALQTPGDLLADGGRLTVCLTNPTSNTPLHLEARSVWVDVTGTRRTTPLVAYLASNTNAFGGSAAQAQTLVLLLSGQGAAVTYAQLVGSSVEVAVMPACALSATVLVSGVLSLWWS